MFSFMKERLDDKVIIDIPQYAQCTCNYRFLGVLADDSPSDATCNQHDAAYYKYNDACAMLAHRFETEKWYLTDQQIAAKQAQSYHDPCKGGGSLCVGVCCNGSP